MKKAFTLIELISVIIIMAIIALIATPIMINVIEDAKNEARKNSVRGYADSVRLSYAEEMLISSGKPLKELATAKTQGERVDCEYVKYDDKKTGTLLHSCKVSGEGNYCYYNGYVYEDERPECSNILNLIMSDGIPYNTPNIYVVSQIPNGLDYSQSKEISVEYPSLKVVEEKYFIKSSEALEISVIGKCGSEEKPIECTEENVSSIEQNVWYQVSGNVTFTVNKNLTIEAIIGNNNEYGSKRTYEVNNIDITEPSVSIEGISTTSDKIVVNAKCEDLESGITKKEYTLDGTKYQESNVFNNLSSTNKYKVKVRCTNGSGISKEIESEEILLSEIIKPTIEQVSQTPSESEYAQSRVIRIIYNGTGIENPKNYYSLDNETWIEVSETTKDIEFTSNGYLYAKTVDGSGNVSSAAFTVLNIDTTAPSISIAVSNIKTDRATITAACSDSESSISKYEYSKDNGNTWVANGTTNTYTFTGLTQGTSYTYKVRCTNGSGITNEESSIGSTSSITKPTIAQVSQTPSGTWAQKRVIRITYNGTGIENPKYYYSLNNSTWTEVTSTTKDVEFTSNGYLYAKTTDPKGNVASAATFSVLNTDSVKPAKPTVTLKLGSTSGSAYTSGSWTGQSVYHIVTSSDSGSGISYYQYSHNGTSWSNDINTMGWNSSYNSNKTQLTYVIGFSGQWDFYVRAVDNAGNASDPSNKFNVKVDVANPTITTSVKDKTVTMTLADNIGLSGYTVTTSTSTPSSWSSVTGTSSSKTWTASNPGTYYAWVKDSVGRTAYKAFTIQSAYICKRATTLHTETCSQTSSSEYCSASGYTASGSKKTTTITYGRLGTKGTLTSGDAFDCDVNGDGVYNATNERFYYVSNLYNTTSKSYNSNYAVLIYYNNTTKGVADNTSSGLVAYDSRDQNWHGPATAKTYLPTTTQWKNVKLSSTNRAIITEAGATSTTDGGTLPTAFSYSGYAARLLTVQEINTACGKSGVDVSTDGKFDTCNYFLENTKYSKSSIGTYGWWTENPVGANRINAWYAYGSSRTIYQRGSDSVSSLGVRPAIEVLKTDIEV